MRQFLTENPSLVALVGFYINVVYTQVVMALPDDLRNFDWRVYLPHVLKSVAGFIPHRTTPPA